MAIFSFKPLNDRTRGFRFNVMGQKGLVRRRAFVSRGYKFEAGKGDCTTILHLGKTSFYFEMKWPARWFGRRFA